MISKPIQIFFAGVVCAALIAIAGFSNTYRLESKMHKLESECIEDGNQNKVDEGKQDELDFSRFGMLVCDAKLLVGVGENKGIQAQIVQAQINVWASKKWPYSIALLVLLFSAAPWSWYFLLRRIREIKDAVVGK